MCGPTASSDVKGSSPMTMTGMLEHEVKLASETTSQNNNNVVNGNSHVDNVDVMQGSVSEIESNVSYLVLYCIVLYCVWN